MRKENITQNGPKCKIEPVKEILSALIEHLAGSGYCQIKIKVTIEKRLHQ
jgi:hypothetical protein